MDQEIPFLPPGDNPHFVIPLCQIRTNVLKLFSSRGTGLGVLLQDLSGSVTLPLIVSYKPCPALNGS